MKLRLNPNRFSNFSDTKRAEEIEKFIDKSMRKFFRSNVTKTKIQSLVEEIEGYYARNSEYHTDICEFNVYVKHWTRAHRGTIDDLFLDAIETEFGTLDGPLYVRPGHSAWDTTRDWSLLND